MTHGSSAEIPSSPAVFLPLPLPTLRAALRAIGIARRANKHAGPRAPDTGTHALPGGSAVPRRFGCLVRGEKTARRLVASGRSLGLRVRVPCYREMTVENCSSFAKRKIPGGRSLRRGTQGD
jgi:hypothetical protein